jgi:hypothetical protein
MCSGYKYRYYENWYVYRVYEKCLEELNKGVFFKTEERKSFM